MTSKKYDDCEENTRKLARNKSNIANLWRFTFFRKIIGKLLVTNLKIGIKIPKISIEKPNKKFLLSINDSTKEKTENSDLKSQNSLM